MNFANGALLVVVGLILLFILVTGKEQCLISFGKCFLTGTFQNPVGAAPSASQSSGSMWPFAGQLQIPQVGGGGGGGGGFNQPNIPPNTPGAAQAVQQGGLQ